jgi:hypothetical protein
MRIVGRCECVADLGCEAAAAFMKTGASWHRSGRPCVSRKWEGSLPFRAGLSRGGVVGSCRLRERGGDGHGLTAKVTAAD